MDKSLDGQSLEDAINATYPGLILFVRDVDLASELAAKYTDGLVVHERGFTDATPRLGGMVTSHRYVIMSNHMADLDALLGGDRDANAPNWRLHVAGRDSYFKVLGQRRVAGKMLIFILHLPNDDRWRLPRHEYPIAWQSAPALPPHGLPSAFASRVHLRLRLFVVFLAFRSPEKTSLQTSLHLHAGGE